MALPKTEDGGGPAGVVEGRLKPVAGAPAGVLDKFEARKKFVDCFDFERESGVEGGLEKVGTVNILLTSASPDCHRT